MNSPAVELAQFLDSEGIVDDFGGDGPFSVHVSREPDQPDDVVTLYDTGGGDPASLDGIELRRPTIQVRVRARDYEAAYEQQAAIFEKLAQPHAVDDGEPLERTIGSARYLSVNLIADILSLGRDENDRHRLVANYQIERQPAEGS
jgi:minor capsid protein